MALKSILVVFAFVLAVIAAIPYPPGNPYTEKLIAASLACWYGSLLF
jgi:hypothetical protein